MHNCIRLLLGASCLFSAAAAQQFTEKELISRYLTGPNSRVTAATTAAARSEWRGRASLDSPGVAYSREDAAGTRDQFFTFSQRVPLNGRLSALRQAGSAAVAESAALSTRGTQVAVAELRTAFHAALAAQRSLAALHSAGTRTAEVVRILRERESAGEASGLERMRVEREHQAVLQQTARARANLLSARAIIEALAAVELGESALVADLAPAAADDPVAFALAHRADYQAKVSELRKQGALQRAASRALIPEPTFTVGTKSTAAGPLRDTGYIASAGVEIPLFGKARAERDHALAEAQRAEAELALLKNRIIGEVNAARQNLVAQQGALAQSASASQDDIAAIALTSYTEGEASLLELLDAYRVTLESQLRAADVVYDLAAAQIAFDLAIGKDVQP